MKRLSDKELDELEKQYPETALATHHDAIVRGIIKEMKMQDTTIANIWSQRI